MTSFREIRDEARVEIHLGLSQPALYYAPGVTDPVLATPCNVCVTEYKVGLVGDVDYQYFPQKVMQDNPIIKFLVSEVMPVRGGRVVLDVGGESYYIDNVEPVYNVTVTARVDRESP